MAEALALRRRFERGLIDDGRDRRERAAGLRLKERLRTLRRSISARVGAEAAETVAARRFSRRDVEHEVARVE